MKNKFLDPSLINESNKNYARPIDTEFKGASKTDTELGDAYLHLVLDHFKDTKAVLEDNELVKNDTSNFKSFYDTKDTDEIIKSHFEITCDMKDKVKGIDINSHIDLYPDLKFIGKSTIKAKLGIFGATYKEKEKI